MNSLKRLLSLALIFAAPLLFATAAKADGHAKDRAVVEAFYSELLSAPTAPDLAERVSKVVVEDWVSVPQPRGGPGAEGMVKTLATFGGIIPDLKWEPVEIIQAGNRWIVRGKATGTPAKPFLGVEPNGKSFEIMSIDIHTVKNGKIVQSYHVEEWIKAKYQLQPK